MLAAPREALLIVRRYVAQRAAPWLARWRARALTVLLLTVIAAAILHPRPATSKAAGAAVPAAADAVSAAKVPARGVPVAAMSAAAPETADMRGAAPSGASHPAATPGGTFHPTNAQLRALTVETVRAASFENVIVTDGRIGINTERATPVFSAHTGRVIEVLARAGERVRRGQVLARLDAVEYAQGLNDLRSSAAQLALASSVAQRKRALLEARGASLQDVEQAEADMAAAQGANAAARMRLRSLGASAADIERLSAAGSGGGAETVALIRAPIAGTITDREIGPGQFLQAGNATPLFTVSDTGSVWLWANVRETDAARVRVGQRIEAELAALPNQPLAGRLDFVAAAIDAATHRLAVHATLGNRDGCLKPEMLATVRIHLGDARNSPAVPESAVVRDGETARVWVVSDGGIAARTVKLGRRSAAAVEVIDGLSAGERIVTRGALLVDAAGLAP